MTAAADGRHGDLRGADVRAVLAVVAVLNRRPGTDPGNGAEVEDAVVVLQVLPGGPGHGEDQLDDLSAALLQTVEVRNVLLDDLVAGAVAEALNGVQRQRPLVRQALADRFVHGRPHGVHALAELLQIAFHARVVDRGAVARCVAGLGDGTRVLAHVDHDVGFVLGALTLDGRSSSAW
ncbi:hypothetical protein CTZ28_42010 [Streptomyces shenzhenensis]|uniref:Uncharacterized protein n=1 Tax=Streptomyces shenzhenensis TaxID=943815 RepID=A0A3M0HU99_9ACTN|nr:hypothetical protein CTZ28_42010 [Streptomyces shenzhenensis]